MTVFTAAAEKISTPWRLSKNDLAADTESSFDSVVDGSPDQLCPPWHRFQDNLFRAELGTFPIPSNADIPSVLLSDGRTATPEPVTALRRRANLKSPQGSIETGTFKMIKIHTKHLNRILRPSMRIQAVSLGDLQSYVDRRAKEQGRRGAAVSAVTIKKEITTWKWAVKSKRLTGEIPVKLLVKQIQQSQKAIRQFDATIAEMMDRHPDAYLFTSLCGAGPTLAPRLHCAFGSQKDRWADADSLAAFCGIARVTRKSGRQCIVHRRFACPKYLRQTFNESADKARMYRPWTRARQYALRDRGMQHHAAIRKTRS